MPSAINVEVIPACRLDKADLESILRLTNSVWPHEAVDPEQEARKLVAEFRADGDADAVRYHLVRESGRVVAVAESFIRRVAWSGDGCDVLALAGVCSDGDRRGAGLGKAVVRSAFRRVDSGELKVCLFQTGVSGFYEKLRCREVTNRFVNSRCDQQEANPWWDDTIMIYPSGAAWPDGTIDLLGPAW